LSRTFCYLLGIVTQRGKLGVIEMSVMVADLGRPFRVRLLGYGRTRNGSNLYAVKTRVNPTSVTRCCTGHLFNSDVAGVFTQRNKICSFEMRMRAVITRRRP
jgi:hypothetical protein